MGWVGVWGLNHGVRPIWFWKRQLTQELPFPTGLTLHLLFSLSPISQRPQYLHLSQPDQFLHTIQKWIQELLIHINGAVIQEKNATIMSQRNILMFLDDFVFNILFVIFSDDWTHRPSPTLSGTAKTGQQVSLILVHSCLGRIRSRTRTFSWLGWQKDVYV